MTIPVSQNPLNPKGLEAARKARDSAWPMDSLEPVIRAYLEVSQEAAAPSEEPVAWVYEWFNDDEFSPTPGHWERGISFTPSTIAMPVRNLRPLVFASPPVATVAVSVKGLDDDQIMEIIKEVAPWKDEPKFNDLLTYEKSPPLFPQATYDVPSYRATKFVRAVEARILSSIIPATKGGEAVQRIEHDGFEGTVIGSYVTREGKRGVVLQQVGTKVVHVYGEKWLAALSQDTETK